MDNYRKIKGKNEIILCPDEAYDATYEHLAPSMYRLWDVGNVYSGTIPMFQPSKEGDTLVKFNTGIVKRVLESADKFFGEETRKIYHELKIAHKLGIIFFGKQGTGKTSTCMLIMRELSIKHNALCLDCTGKTLNFIKLCIHRIREIQNNPIVIFVDEFDSNLRKEEDAYLTFLDGSDSVDNLIFIACTNYIDKIPDRIKKRKSRIKHLHNINSLPLGVYKEYLTDRLPNLETSVVAQFAYLAEKEGLTIDQFKHALIDYKLEGMPVEKAIKSAATFSDQERP